VDLGAYYGGNCQITQINQLYFEAASKVKILGYTDYESRVARRASELYSQCILHLIEELIE
jgi:NAD/NADP transhydrogenase alpha subunit